jgi:hypothetical protein
VHTSDHPMRMTTTGHLYLSEERIALVAADLVYRPRDCLAVNMVLCGPDGVEASWTFAWRLLARGLVAPAGDGDIVVRPVGRVTPSVETVLTSTFTARMRFPAREVGYFVSKVRSRARQDAQHIRRSLDAELATITESV